MRKVSVEEFCLVATAVAMQGIVACSGTVPGLAREPARPAIADTARISSSPPSYSRPAPFPVPNAVNPGGAPSTAAGGFVAPAPIPPATPANTAPPVAPAAPGPRLPAPPAAAASAPPELTARDRQMTILTDAVAALRQEIARSYAHSEELAQETQQLRRQIARLRTELATSREENQALKSQIRTLEKRLREIHTPAPVAKDAPPPSSEPAPAEPPTSDVSPEAAR